MFGPNSTTLYLVYSLVSALLIFYVIFTYKNRKILKFAWNENGFFLPILPLIGTAYIALLTGDRGNTIATLNWIHKKIGFPCSFWLGHHYIYATCNASEVKVILNHPHCFDKPRIYDDLRHGFGNSLLLVPYDIWKPRRKLYMKSYKPRILKSYFPTIYNQSCEVLKEIKDLRKGHDLFEFFNKYAFTNFFYTSAGLEENEAFPDMGRFGELIDLTQEGLAKKLLDPVTPASLWFKFYPSGRRNAKYFKELKAIANRFIKLKRKQHANVKSNGENSNTLHVMDHMMNNLTDDEIYDEMLLFAGAATDTTGHALPFLFTLLGMHPEIQDTLYNEVMSVVGYNNITNEDLSYLKYTEAVIYESMRLYPSVPTLARHTNAEIDLGTKVLPKGIGCSVSLYHLHRDPGYWKDPLKFDPTRFLPENAHQIQPYTYLPFSGGPRDCIGRGQAMLLMKTTVSNIIRTFRVTSNYRSIDEIILTSCISIKSKHPLDCNFISRLED